MSNLPESHYAAGIIVDFEGDEPSFLVLEYDSGKGRQIKFPGGTNVDKPGETADETVHREVRQETSLVFVRDPLKIYERRLPPRNGEGSHTKYAFLIDYSDCGGDMRIQPFQEGGGGGDHLSPPFWRTASELLNPEAYGFKKDDGLFSTHRPMLEAALMELKKRKGK